MARKSFTTEFSLQIDLESCRSYQPETSQAVLANSIADHYLIEAHDQASLANRTRRRTQAAAAGACKGSSRNFFPARIVSPTNPSRTASCVMTNGGSCCVGAIDLSKEDFSND